MSTIISEQDLICAFDVSTASNAVKINSDNLETEIADGTWRWIHLDRTGTGVERWLRTEAQVPELAIAPLLADETRPRIQSIEHGYIINLRGVNLNPNASPEDMVAIRLWIEEDRIISLRKHKLLAVQDIRDSYDANNGPAAIGDFLCQLVLGLITRMSDVVLELDDQLDELEAKVTETLDGEDQRTLGNVRRKSIMLKRFLSPQRDAISKIANLKASWMDASHELRVRDAYDQTARMVEALDAIRERAGLLHEELSSKLAERNNRNGYVLAVVAAIFLPLGFLTGLLGVNVGGIPGVDNPFGFLWVTISIVLLGVLEFLLLKTLKWI